MVENEKENLLKKRQQAVHTKQMNKSSSKSKFVGPLNFALIAIFALFFYKNFIMPATTVDPFLDRDVLPATVKPLNYALRLQPDFATFKFTGNAEIKLKVVQDTAEISLNAVELDFQKTVLKVGDKEIFPLSQDYDEKMETMKFTFPHVLTAGTECSLLISYIGTHNDKMAGFYRSEYLDTVTNEKKMMVVTQFEPTDARKAFPCWDEPALKATFDVTLIIPEKMTGLSNMNDVSTSFLSDGLKEIKFARTPIMSTYLVAFVVGELSSIETHTKDAQKTLVRVFAPTGLEKQGEFALGVAARTLEFFADYFGIAYPLPKMDMVAIPDFAAGAMENWGLVTYRTVYLLFDEKTSAARSKQQIAYVVGHELAHQWFGNLVSPGWWSDLWLNEGFATWAGWLSTDHLFPEWDIWTQFVNDDFQRGLSLDALRSSHPIEVPVKNPAEIHQIFDAISYSKGASVIRMLANYLGKEDFRQGVRNYLQDFKYRNADTINLWNHLSAAAGNKPVAELMNSWTRQMGYPLLSVKQVKNDTGSSLKIRQVRFLSSGNVQPEDDKSIWFTPLQIISSASPKSPSSDVLSEKENLFQVKGLSLETMKDDDFYKINYGHSGFYRTKYESGLLKKLGRAIKNGKIGSADRIGVLTDTFSIAKAGESSVVDGLALLDNFSNEKDYIVWAEIASELATMRSVWWEQPEETRNKLKAMSRNLFSKVAKEMGWKYPENEGHLKSLLRTLAIGVAGNCGDEEIIAESQKRFKEFVGGKTDAIDPNLRGAVFSIVLKNGGKTEYDQVLKIYRETKTADQKLIALSALGAVTDESLLKQTLEFGLGEEVRPQDVIYVFGSVGGNTDGRKLAWEFVKQKWDFLYDRYYKGSMSLLSRIVTSTADHFSSEEWHADVQQFFADKDLPAISRSIQQTLEKIKSNSNWLKRDQEAVDQFLKSHQ